MERLRVFVRFVKGLGRRITRFRRRREPAELLAGRQRVRAAARDEAARQLRHVPLARRLRRTAARRIGADVSRGGGTHG